MAQPTTASIIYTSDSSNSFSDYYGKAMVIFRFISLMLSPCFFASCAGPTRVDVPMPIPTKVQRNSQGYQVQVGDLLDVFVIEDSSFNGAFAIRPSGDIIMPKVGRVSLQGLTLLECEKRIQQALQANQIKIATVIVDPGTRGAVENGGLTVRLSGEVVKPGRTTIKPLGNTPVSAYQAIVDSGGFLPFANKKKAYVLRNSPSGVTRLNVNFEDVESGRTSDPPLSEGDCIVVPKKIFGL